MTHIEARQQVADALDLLDVALRTLARVKASRPYPVDDCGPTDPMQHLCESAAVAHDALRPEVELLRADLGKTPGQLVAQHAAARERLGLALQ